MKIFQTLHKYAPYISQFEEQYNITDDLSFDDHLRLLMNDRFYAAHILSPCLDLDDPNGFYTMWNYEALQHKWAGEKGWKETDLKKILYAQIEEFKPDVFYNGSPILFEKDEILKNIDEKITKVCWFASPEKKQIDFSAYKTRLTNFPLDANFRLEKDGFRSDLFQPAHDPVMDQYARNTHRDIDLFFYGQYVDAFFKNRNKILDELTKYKRNNCKSVNIELCVSYRLKYNSLYPFKRPVRIKNLLRIKHPLLQYPSKTFAKMVDRPVYGLRLYEKLSRTKIAFNAAVDFTGSYKVNMRNFEATGCGAHLLSDEGIYPEGFERNKTLSTYVNFGDFIKKLEYYLQNRKESLEVAQNGHNMVKNIYSKENQYIRFKQIVSEISG